MYLVIAALLGTALLLWLGLAMRAATRRGRPDPIPHSPFGAAGRLDPDPGWNAGPLDQNQTEAGTRYRARPTGTGPRWDPYAADQSRRHRVRADRRRGRSAAATTTKSLAAYRMLGVAPTASPHEVERAYRRHVADIHPDRFHGDPARQAQAEQKLKELNATMQTLREERRAN